MKTITFFILVLFSTSSLLSQQLSPEDILGSWKAVDLLESSNFSEGLDEEGQKKMDQLKSGFIGTIFSFHENNNFDIKFSESMPDIMKEMEFEKENKWKIGEENLIQIGTEENRYSIMGIHYLPRSKKTYFLIDLFFLEVVKI